MIILAIPAPTAVLRTLTQAALKHHPQWRPIRQLRSPCLRLTRRPNHPRCFTHQPPTPHASNTSEALKRAAKPAAQSEKHHKIPERLIIYHAGTGRITFLATLKLTSLLLGAFFTLPLIPSSIKAEKPPPSTAAVAAALCGIIPVLFIAYSTAPFVTHMHIHLPATARTSPAALTRFVAAMPPGTPLTLTTMSLAAKPRHSAVSAGDLRAAVARKRMGLVNYVRDTRADNARRKWYMYRALGGFYVHDDSAHQAAMKKTTRTRTKTKTVVHTWIWEALRDKIAKRAAASGSV